MKIYVALLALIFTTFTAFAGVNINTATKADLEKLPGVGATTADAIIAARPYKTVDDLKKVKGIGEVKFKTLKPMLETDLLATTDSGATLPTSMSDAKGMTDASNM